MAVRQENQWDGKKLPKPVALVEYLTLPPIVERIGFRDILKGN